MSEPLRYEDMVKGIKYLTEPHKPDSRSVVEKIADFYGLSDHTRDTLRRAWAHTFDIPEEEKTPLVRSMEQINDHACEVVEKWLTSLD